ncbi:Adenine-specific DNA methylase [Curtobacterium sp. YR515]|nr:Adenine-specific DNA methylase [Curtobacterium sp. YR515]
MLAGTLGDQLTALAPDAERFVDLFAGSGAVSRYVATTTTTPVVALDLMAYSSAITAGTVTRTGKVDAARLFQAWEARADRWLRENANLLKAAAAASSPQSENDVSGARALCRAHIEGAFIWSDYGGYYYSPLQALHLSALHSTLPVRAPSRTVALAALLRTASRASASPGHTAQPFRPTERLLPHLRSAWSIDVRREVRRQLEGLAPFPAKVQGQVITGDSVAYAQRHVRDGDLVFCDPPYSEAQYSRFYHVLEGIARGGWISVSGAGRAPSGADRPSSDFSRRTRAIAATENLLTALAKRRTTVLWTYPEGERSNGLTVEDIRRAASEFFTIKETRIPMRHSTLGGSKENGAQRLGRKELHEVLFRFESKATTS